MRIDWYTKGVLTIIAVLLAVIALWPYVSPDAEVQAQGPFAGLQFAAYTPGLYVFSIPAPAMYGITVMVGKPLHFRLAKLGAPLVEVK
jgi:hypothetical protein